MHRAQCPNLAAFRALEPAALFAAWQDEKAADGNKMRTAPVIDGQLIPRDGVLAAQRGDQCHVPYLMGSTSQDIVPPIVHKLARTGAACRRTRAARRPMPGSLTASCPAMTTAPGIRAICGIGLARWTIAGGR